MRRILVLLACLLLSALPVLAIGCGDDKEEVLVLYSGRSESLIAPAIEKFTKDTATFDSLKIFLIRIEELLLR